jgi:hypothetical protein
MAQVPDLFIQETGQIHAGNRHAPILVSGV